MTNQIIKSVSELPGNRFLISNVKFKDFPLGERVLFGVGGRILRGIVETRVTGGVVVRSVE